MNQLQFLPSHSNLGWILFVLTSYTFKSNIFSSNDSTIVESDWVIQSFTDFGNKHLFLFCEKKAVTSSGYNNINDNT